MNRKRLTAGLILICGCTLVSCSVPTSAGPVAGIAQVAAWVFFWFGIYLAMSCHRPESPGVMSPKLADALDMLPLRGRWLRLLLTGLAVAGFLFCLLAPILSSYTIAAEWMIPGSLVCVVVLAGLADT